MNRHLLVIFALSAILTACMSKPKTSEAPAEIKGYDAELTGYAYPRQVNFFEFESQKQKLKMAYLLAEPGKPNGKTVILLHGKNFGAWYWEKTIAALAEKGYRVLAPDQIGFGKSSKPGAYQFTFQQLAANTKLLAEHLKIEKASVVGHSMGGMLAVRYALQYPEATEKLILVNPIGLEDWKTKVPYHTVDHVYAAELQLSSQKIRDYQRMSYFAGEWKPEYDKLIEAASGWTQHPDYPRVAWNSALTADMIFTQPVIYEFPLIKTKTLLIIGTRDRTALGKDRVSESVGKNLGNYEILGKRAKKAIKGSRLVELKNVGHMPQIEAWDSYINNVTKFLSAP